MTALPPSGTYDIDPVHSTASFVVRHLVASKVRGVFNEFSGTLVIGDTFESSSITASVKADSVSTNTEMRDNHIRSADFLQKDTYPTLDFKSTKITSKGGDDYELVGDLTMHGVTKSVTFDLEYLGSGPGVSDGVTAAGFEARGEIDRRDYGVNFEGVLENGAIVVGYKIVLEINIEALTRQ